jgi:5'-deoxynucleotidase YfbR-like HD superfamily hydrolase
MVDKLKFLIEAEKLKEFPRTGWVLRGVKNPETIAEHMVGVAIASWILGREADFKPNKLIEMGFFHDLCEVYAGDVTPFFYFIRNLPKNEKERKKFLRKYVRLSKTLKEKRGKEKFELEKKSLLNLLSFLKTEERKRIFSLWLDFEKRTTKEGNFVRQVDKIETLIQAILYFGTKRGSFAEGWWEEVEEFTEHPLLLEFLKVIQRKFYGKEIKFKNKKLEAILDFILEIEKIKKIPRMYWTLRGIKKPETVGGHIFTVTLMAWVLGKEKEKLNQGKLLKMALCHELSSAYTGDTTPYDRILPKDEKERKKVLEKMIRLSKKEKKWIFLADYKKEKKAMEKLTNKLDLALRKEILTLWHEYRMKESPEAKFLSQLNTLAILLQGLFYEKTYKNFSTSPLWEWAFENCDDEVCLSLMDEMKKKFYG